MEFYPVFPEEEWIRSKFRQNPDLTGVKKNPRMFFSIPEIHYYPVNFQIIHQMNILICLINPGYDNGSDI
jgi:hypothetical protein